MLVLLKNATTYAPEYLGKKDILVCGENILSISKDIPSESVASLGGEIIDCFSNIVVPGFVDGHVHPLGGGGEGGFSSRTPEGFAEDFIEAGTTTIVGMLGTDGITRDHVSLLAKTRDFGEKGLNAYMLTGSYRYPVKTITGDLAKDIVLIPEIIGVGEVAISDHRSSNVSAEELQRLAMDARVAGLLSGKSGVCVFHLGDAQTRLEHLFKATEDGTLSPRQVMPTHISRSNELLKEGLRWVKERGGYIDFTANEEFTHVILKDLYDQGVDFGKICVSSDACGSLPVFDDQKNLTELKSAPVNTLMKVFVNMVNEAGMEISKALMPFTVNPARFYRLVDIGIGVIEESKRANLLIMSKDLETLGVFSRGKFLLNRVSRGE
ncbi:MAG TPA: beta-aspartyl-peptidase [Kosmotogaceae bacterium]|nr:beta-aspartyl-peptidase [Kosmotogaceae bacterium]